MAVTNGTGPSKVFRVATLVKLANLKLTDQGRGDVSVDVERIEDSRRLANGTMRKYIVADKHTFVIGWDNIPADTPRTVDGGAGGKEIEAFYLANQGPVTATITWGDGTTKVYQVFLRDFSKDYVTRYRAGDNWNMSLTMEEI